MDSDDIYPGMTHMLRLRDALRPFFIIGTERSGSNLLRLVLNSHSRLVVPHPPHIMNLMAPLESSYGDLGRDRNFYPLVVDVCTLVRLHAYPWEIELDPAEIMEMCRFRNLFSVYAAVYERYMRHAGKRRWGCKSTFMIHEADNILKHYRDAQLILLVRDPRDVAVSARTSVYNHFHPWFVGELWAREQRKGIRLLEQLPEERIHRMHYEALVKEPEVEVRRLCDFLREDFEERMLSFFDTDEARKSASLSGDWKNTDRGFLGDNFGKFMRELSRTEIAMVEAQAESEMTALEYRLVTEPAERVRERNPGMIRRLGYHVEEWRRRLEVERKSFRTDRNFGLRMRKLLFVRWLHLKALARRRAGMR